MVEAFSVQHVNDELGLSREDFIALAFFLGSDYTDGVNGVGIVNAMEIIKVLNNQHNIIIIITITLIILSRRFLCKTVLLKD
jgi:DNA excision repair protein ERCC-5